MKKLFYIILILTTYSFSGCFLALFSTVASAQNKDYEIIDDFFESAGALQ